LNEEHKQQLPKVLADLLEDVRENGKTRPPAKPGFRHSSWQWENIICQYFVFLIVEDHKAHLINLIPQVTISWRNYDLIKDTVSTIIDAINGTFGLFIKTSNTPDSLWYNKYPRWDLKNA
jgi:hypothetical protein